MRLFLFPLLTLTVLMFTAFAQAQSDETGKIANLLSMSDSWRYLNAFDAEKYIEQQKTLGGILDQFSLQARNIESFRKIAQIFQILDPVNKEANSKKASFPSA